jgi:hypothetical protein
MAVEAAALTWLEQLCPAHAPQLLLYDDQQSVLAMSWVPSPHIKLVDAIQKGQVSILQADRRQLVTPPPGSKGALHSQVACRT